MLLLRGYGLLIDKLLRILYYIRMGKNSMSVIIGHELEDKRRAETEYLQMVAEDFENAEAVLGMLGKGGQLTEEDIIIPIRKSDKFSMRKHVTCFAKYTHTHTFYEMIYVHKGRCVQYAGGEQAPRIICEREVCLLSPGTLHALEPAAEDDLALKIVIPPDVFDFAANSIGASGLTAPDGIAYFTTDGSRFAPLLFALLDETFTEKQSAGLAVKHYLALMLLELVRENPATDKEFHDGLKSYIEADFARASLSGFSELLGYSPRQTARIIKQKLGKSFSDMSAQLRIARAAELLRLTDASVETIAAELGYAGASGLYKQFSAHFGLTPGEYRNLTG